MWGQIEMRQQYEYSGRNTNRRKRNRDCLINWMLKSGHRQTKCLKTAPESPRAAMWSILPEAKLPILSSQSKSSFPLQFIQAYLLPACGPTPRCLKTAVWVWQNGLLLIWHNSFEREKKNKNRLARDRTAQKGLETEIWHSNLIQETENVKRKDKIRETAKEKDSYFKSSF